MNDHFRSVESSRALVWISSAYQTFKKAPYIFVGFLAIDWVITGGVSRVPKIGWAINTVLTTLFYAGWLLALRKLERGETLGLKDIFGAFRNYFGDVLILDILSVLFGMVLFVPLIGIFLAATFAGITGLSAAEVMNSTLLIVLISVGLIVVLAYCFVAAFCISSIAFFALPLVIFKKMDPWPALVTSLKAAYANLWTLGYLYLIYFGFALLGVLTLGLGFLVLLPLIKIGDYNAYLDVFEKLTPTDSSPLLTNEVDDNAETAKI